MPPAAHLAQLDGLLDILVDEFMARSEKVAGEATERSETEHAGATDRIKLRLAAVDGGA